MNASIRFNNIKDRRSCLRVVPRLSVSFRDRIFALSDYEPVCSDRFTGETRPLRSRLEHDSCGVGLVAHIKGQRSHQLVVDAGHVLRRMNHRGACGCEANTGDGAGILTALPHEFLSAWPDRPSRASLPEAGEYAAGLVFLPTLAAERAECKRVVEQLIARQGQRLVGWRKVPVCPDEANIGPSARPRMPVIEQLFVAAGSKLPGDAFERQLYLIRKQASHGCAANATTERNAQMFYVCSLSTQGHHLQGHAHDRTSWCRSIPTWPTRTTRPTWRWSIRGSRRTRSPVWDRAQPMRFMSHNGEINTLRGNMNWMQRPRGRGRQRAVRRRALPKLFPIVEPDCSRLGHLRQRARIPADDGPHAAGSGHDDDSRGVAEPRDDARGQAGVLRVPLVPDGAVGRPGVDRLHRRQVHRRRARPQRPAPQPLLPDARRPRDHGQRSRRAADRAARTSRPRAGCSRAGCSWSISSKAG